MGKTVRQLLNELDSRELSEWMAFWQIEPWGEERADRRAATVAATVANVHRPKGRRAYKAEDFMPHYGPRRPQTWQEQLEIVKGIHNALRSKPRGDSR